MTLLRRSLAVVALLGISKVTVAQTDTGRVPPVARPGRAGRGALPLRPGQAARQVPGREGAQAPLNPNQAAMREVRQAMQRVMRRQLNLNDQQMRTLQQTDMKYERQRQELLRTETQTRRELRAMMLDTTGTRDQNKIAGYIDQLTQARRKGVDLAEAEQKELAGFLTPMQRAQYLGIKEQLDRRLQKIRQDNQAARAAAGAPAAVKPDTLFPER